VRSCAFLFLFGFFDGAVRLVAVGCQRVAPAAEVFGKGVGRPAEIFFQDDFAQFAQRGADCVEGVCPALVFCIGLLQLILKLADAFVLVADV